MWLRTLPGVPTPSRSERLTASTLTRRRHVDQMRVTSAACRA